MAIKTIAPLADDEVRVYTLATGEREVTRAAVRRVLAALLGVAVEEVKLEYGAKGKPTLRNDPGLHFSVAHSAGASMIAVTRVGPVGVDVERVRTVPMAEAILRRFFPDDESLSMLPGDERDTRFVSIWTRAEATVKVRGASLWEAATPDPSVTVRELEAPAGYAASVAVSAADHAGAWRVTQVAYDVNGSAARGGA